MRHQAPCSAGGAPRRCASDAPGEGFARRIHHEAPSDWLVRSLLGQWSLILELTDSEAVMSVVNLRSAHSGHTPTALNLNLNVRGLGQSATLAINERSAALQQGGRTVYRLGLGQSPFPVPDSVVDALKANAHQKDYLPVKGLQRLREAVAAYHDRVNAVSRGAEDVLIGPGSKELMFILQLVFYGAR